MITSTSADKEYKLWKPVSRTARTADWELPTGTAGSSWIMGPKEDASWISLASLGVHLGWCPVAGCIARMALQECFAVEEEEVAGTRFRLGWGTMGKAWWLHGNDRWRASQSRCTGSQSRGQVRNFLEKPAVIYPRYGFRWLLQPVQIRNTNCENLFQEQQGQLIGSCPPAQPVHHGSWGPKRMPRGSAWHL